MSIVGDNMSEQKQENKSKEEPKKMGRPTEYKEEFIDKVDEYLEDNQDTYKDFIKQKNIEKGYEMFDRGLTVKLPTIEGFALFIGVSKKVLYTWEQKHPDFLHALDKIRTEQQQRLINMGLSKDYNSTIAKLILSSNHNMVEKTQADVNLNLPEPLLEHVRNNNSNKKNNSSKEED